MLPVPPEPGLPPDEFLRQLNDAVDLNSEAPPTAEQWRQMRALMRDQVAGMVHRRMREIAEQSKEQEMKLTIEQIRFQAELQQIRLAELQQSQWLAKRIGGALFGIATVDPHP